MILKNILLTLSAFLFFNMSIAQDAQQLLNGVINKINSVKDYSADVNIKADIPLIKILPVKAKIYFKKPNKFKVKSKSIAILPKQNMTELNGFLSSKKNYMVVGSGNEIISNIKCQILTVIPNSSENEIILAKLWVNTLNKTILKSELTTRSSGNLKAKYKYSNQVKYGLPSSIIFTVDVKEFKIPKSISSNPHRSQSNKKNKKKYGEISIAFSNYKVNKGLSDSIFK